MATIKITLNGEQVPFSCFTAGADVEPNLYLNYDNWATSVQAENITDVEAYTEKMTSIFVECGANISNITFETI